MEAFWVFGYGSLMWNPGFAYQEAVPAQAAGYHRSLCIYSHHHRGTKQRPGLVMGLNPGGSCRGLAFYVSGREAPRAYRYLQQREQIGQTYREKHIPLKLHDGRQVESLAFITDLNHAQFAGDRPAAALAEIVAAAKGSAGTNYAYVKNTVQSLRRLNIYEPQLEAVLRHLPAAAETEMPQRKYAAAR